jgi:hypothetical protein
MKYFFYQGLQIISILQLTVFLGVYPSMLHGFFYLILKGRLQPSGRTVFLLLLQATNAARDGERCGAHKNKKNLPFCIT